MKNKEHHVVWLAWHQASVNRDQEALLSLYAEDAVLEAPLVAVVLRQESGVVKGRDGIRAFLDQARKTGASSNPPRVPMRWWREEHSFSAGDTLIWEYPRETPEGDQMDIVEVMKIEGGSGLFNAAGWAALRPPRRIQGPK